jgi:DMSO/TMAO reductase YedYZ molybdopterin-dependent catalytic subunit
MANREGVKYPAFAAEFARIDFEADPLPVLCLFPLPELIPLEDATVGLCGLELQPKAVPWKDLATLPRVSLKAPLICQIFNWVETVEWEGIRLVDVLDAHGIETSPDGYYAVYSRDGHFFESFSRDEARDPRVLLAYGLNGRPLPEEHGGPLRLVVPFLQGYKSVKWVRSIRAFRTDTIGIKRLRGQSRTGRLNQAWKDRMGIVPPDGRAGDPP